MNDMIIGGDTALFRKLEKSTLNSVSFKHALRGISLQISYYRLLYLNNKGSALAYIANKTANQLQNKVDYILQKRGII